MISKSPSTNPCERYETACLDAAWGLGDDPKFAAHRETCPRCRNALATTRAFVARCRRAAEPVPERVRHGLARELAATVFERTTCSRTAAVKGRWVWAGVGAGLATAAAALLALRPPSRPTDTDAMDLADVELELLENLELAENLELLEVLEALEELDDG